MNVLAAVMPAPRVPIEIREFPEPDLPLGGALLRTAFSEVCGTDVHLWHGNEVAEDVDVSAKWFADTDKLLKEYQRLLREGKSVLTLTAPEPEHRDEITAILRQHNAQLITHFGTWVMETI